jgi:hypothetical protein
MLVALTRSTVHVNEDGRIGSRRDGAVKRYSSGTAREIPDFVRRLKTRRDRMDGIDGFNYLPC